MNRETEQAVLNQLVGCWEGTSRRRRAADEPFEESACKSETRWMLGGKFVEMTLRGAQRGDEWSSVLYIGYERSERCYVAVTLEPGDRRVTISRGDWAPDPGRLLLTSRHTGREEARQSRIVCDVRTPGELKLELAEKSTSGEEFVRFRADYHAAVVAAPAPATTSGRRRRSVIA